MKKLSLLFVLCAFSMLAFAQTDSSSMEQQDPTQQSQSGWATLNPMSWSLGNVPLVFPVYQVFTVSNGSTANVTMGGVSVTNGSYFVGNGCPHTLMADSVCFITVEFFATSVGAKPATLTVNTSGGALQTDLTATALTDDVTLNPVLCGGNYCYTQLQNGDVVLTLTNHQQTSLTIKNIVGSPPSFSIAPATTCPEDPSQGTVPPHGSCTIKVHYTGNAGDQVTGTLTVTDNATDKTPYWIYVCNHHPYCGTP